MKSIESHLLIFKFQFIIEDICVFIPFSVDEAR